MIKGYKFAIAAIVAGFMFAPSVASADPVTDLLDGIFHQPRTQQAAVAHSRHGRHAASATEQTDNSWFPGQAFVGAGQRMVASFYGHGEKLSSRTASGQRFNPHAMTAAHKTLPFGTRLHVCHRGCVTVVVNDRGPFVRGRQLDLSYGAARAIGMGSTSTVHVTRVN
jgi:rare lipoprotein A